MALQKITTGSILGIVAISVVISALVGALFVVNQTIPNSGNVKTVGVNVYWDKACTNRVSSISWGTVEPGGTESFTIYVQNNGTAAEVLSMATGNWNPAAASSYISLAWNCTDYVLAHNSVVGALLTLTVSSSITGISTFGFDITMTGTENTS